MYLAEDLKLKRKIALKFLPAHLTADKEAAERFEREAQAAAALNHPNIVTIYEIAEHDNQTFIAMEYVDGQSLREKMDGKQMPVDEVIDIATQLCEGLDKAHKAGIVHRDIKPENILIDSDGRVKILDFGLAKLKGASKLTKEQSTVGTVFYMSPEQSQGMGIDQRTDLWSLGVILYEMLIGEMPFKGDYEQAVVYSILNEKQEPLTLLREGVPVELERIVNKALVKNTNERYQHVHEILNDLKNLDKTSVISGDVASIREAEKKSAIKWFTRIVFPVGILTILAAALFIFAPSLFDDEEISNPTPIAVISFENQTGDPSFDYLQKAIPNLLITSLEQSKYLRVTTWERMYDLIKQQGKSDVGIIDRDLGFELCRMDDVNTIVLGSFIKAGDQFATDVKVLDVESKRILKSVSARGQGVGSILESQIDELSREISKGVGLSDHKMAMTQKPIAEVTTSSMQAYNYFLRGREEFEKGYIKDAQQFLNRAINIDSTFATAYSYLAGTYYWEGNTIEANQALEKARLHIENATEKEKILIGSDFFGSYEEEQGLRLNSLKELARKYPNDKRVYLNLGWFYQNWHKVLDYPEAIKMYNKSLELDPNYGLAMLRLARLYGEIGDFENSLAYYERYESLYPADARLFALMGGIYLRMGKVNEAIGKLKEAIEIKPDYYSPMWDLGYVYATMENYTEAKKWYDRFIAENTFPAEIAFGHFWKNLFHDYWLGAIKQSQENIDIIANLAKETGNKYGFGALEWINGWIAYEKGDFESSRRYHESSLENLLAAEPAQKPFWTANSHYFLGLVDVKQGRIDEARKRLVEIRSLLPHIIPARQSLIMSERDLLYGEMLIAADSLERTIAVCEKMRPFDIPAFSIQNITVYNMSIYKDVLARAYHQSGALDKAIAEYERLITFEPDSKERYLIHPKLHYRLAKLYEEKGAREKAHKEYEKFLDIWKNADEDLPELIDAKARYAKLTEAG